MIPLPNYDDQTFEDIVEAAKRRIPVIYPEWTDMNEHDPGITILELFAWLKEMQQYHLNRITKESYASMLELLNTPVREPAPAQALAVFPIDTPECILPAGTRFETEGGTVYETLEEIRLDSCSIRCVYVHDGNSFIDIMEILREPGIYCHAFGQKPVEGTSALYICLEGYGNTGKASFFLQFDNSFPVDRNKFADDSPMPRDIVWEYGVQDDAGVRFKAAEVLKDTTHAFSESGEVLLGFGEDFCRTQPGEGLPEGYWLRARLIGKGCEENPRIVNIYKGAVQLSQCKTICDMQKLILGDTVSEAELELSGRHAADDRYVVFVRDRLGWRIHNDADVSVQGGDSAGTAVLKLWNIPQELALDGDENIRVFRCEKGYESKVFLSGSNGLPCQSFPLQFDEIVLRDQLTMMVCEETEVKGELRWFEWSHKNKLSRCGPYDRCFSYNADESEVVFGDNEQGAVPPACENGMVITRCVLTKGTGGNLPAQEFKPILSGDGVEIHARLFYAKSGRDSENVAVAIERLRHSLKKPVKAVTAADYEQLALKTPGLRIFSAKAIPCYDPDSRMASDRQARATVTLVVLPYSEEKFPMPDKRFIEAVRKHMEQYRLITTMVKVTGPVYIKFSVDAEVMLEDERSEKIELQIREAIEQHFSVSAKAALGKQPEFGGMIRENLLMMIIGGVPGVRHVKRVSLSVRSGESYRDKYGNIILPRHGIAYLGDLQIREVF